VGPRVVARAFLPVLALFDILLASCGAPRDLLSFLHDALPISWTFSWPVLLSFWRLLHAVAAAAAAPALASTATSCRNKTASCSRSEEHTSELQSRENLVCRLLLEKTTRRPRSTTWPTRWGPRL